MPKKRLYSIEIRDARTGQGVVLAAADWSKEELDAAIAQICQLAGIADERFPPPAKATRPQSAAPSKRPVTSKM
jgi:hypothetical protein